MKLLHDYYIITVDKRYEDSKTETGITKVNSAVFKGDHHDQEQRDEKHFEYKRLYGEVITCPANFTDTVYNLIDEGIPEYKMFVGHDFIQSYHNRGHQYKKSIPKYYPSTFDGYKTITRADIARHVDVQVNDRVYFDYIVTEPENLLGKFKGKEMYKLSVESILCVVRTYRSKVDKREKKEIIMQGGWMLVDPDMETWEEITTPSGILRKPRPEARYLRGTVRHVRNKDRVRTGQRIIYIPDANFDLKVEGKDYYCMREDEIIGFY